LPAFSSAPGVAALNVSAVDYLRGPGRNPHHARLLEATAAANVPLLTLSVEFEQRYVHAVAQHGRDRFLRANPSHTSAVLPLVQTCLTAMDLIVVYTLQTVGGEGGEKANEAILARAAGGHDDDEDEAGTVGAEGSGLVLVATASGDGGGGDDDDDDDDDAPVELGRGKGVTMEVTTVSTWIVPLGATVEDICALARGTETARSVLPNRSTPRPFPQLRFLFFVHTVPRCLFLVVPQVGAQGRRACTRPLGGVQRRRGQGPVGRSHFLAQQGVHSGRRRRREQFHVMTTTRRYMVQMCYKTNASKREHVRSLHSSYDDVVYRDVN
jgi:hypothetical protein